MCEILEEKQSNQERELNFEPVIIDYSLFFKANQKLLASHCLSINLNIKIFISIQFINA